ncbi:MAG: multicopper oxidase domain-containing protein [Bacteroidetes bacterium]|nr:multicopper oxidase domain-containing protein [Bacteroidota bacterium]
MSSFTIFLLCCCTSTFMFAQGYNALWIPDTLSGNTITLTAKQGSMMWWGSTMTMTAGFNAEQTGRAFWGPTIILRKGDSVHMVVKNELEDTTTVHWHGMHLPAVMDGGPHQPIPPGTTWSPYWKVDNHAATYWYHPHLHMMAQEQLLMGLGGMMIVRDDEEAALALPRTYGVDDIPLALSDRAVDASKQIKVKPYGDSMQVNGVFRAEWNAPSQVVRFRILNASTERSYNLGFSDQRSFHVIASDGGLLAKPVTLDRYLLSSGERIEILVDLSKDAGKDLFLKAFNSVLAQNVPGGDRIPVEPFVNALARIDFNIMHIVVGAPTSDPITAIPAALVTVQALKESDAVRTRALTISDTNIAGNAGVSFLINHRLFDENFIDYNVPLGSTEIWSIANSGNFSHPFHIHDVEFNVLSRKGVAPPEAERGWKDVVLVNAKETVRFIARFADFADAQHPYMFHCHIALHEDEGMMGQFVVVDTIATTSVSEQRSADGTTSMYPVPASSHVTITSTTPFTHVTIRSMLGEMVADHTVASTMSETFRLASLPSATYVVQLDGQRPSLLVVNK